MKVFVNNNNNEYFINIQ